MGFQPLRPIGRRSGRADRLPIRASFCSSWDADGRCIFDPQYFPYQWWRWKVHGDEIARQRYERELDRKWRNGITHIVLDPPDGSVYLGDQAVQELPDWMADGDLDPLFRAMVADVLSRGFVGVFYCFGGGQQDAPAIYDGRLRRMGERIRAEGWTQRLIVGWAWESTGRDPEASAKQNDDAMRVLWEALGPEAMLFMHTGSRMPQRFTTASYEGSDPNSQPNDAFGRPCRWNGHVWIEADDPSHGDEIGAWYTSGMKHVKVFLGQLDLEVPRPGSYEGRLIEGLDRFFAPGTPVPAVGTGTFLRDDPADTRPFAIGPHWFDGRDGGPVEYCMWEPGLPFTAIRGHATQADVERVARDMDGLGIRSQGCLPVGD